MHKTKFKGQNALSGKWVYGNCLLNDKNGSVIVAQDGVKHHVLLETVSQYEEFENEVCKYWKEIDGYGGYSYEYCRLENKKCYCCGTKNQCGFK